MIKEYSGKVDSIGCLLGNKRGIQLLHDVKRVPMLEGPYPGVTLFEGANRILTDLVILYGVKYLIDNNIYNYSSYDVELGVESYNQFDITAINDTEKLAGEAFNVAPSFYQAKKSSALKKLRVRGNGHTHKLLIINKDAVSGDYIPDLGEGFKLIKVDIYAGRSTIYGSAIPRA
ncbi:MAG: hypothetical protein ACYC3G_04965 [Minisyncoccota bacterium]